MILKKNISNKNLDVFNLFYSIGAVLILFGVVCNILNIKYQNFFLVLGLVMEMLIFGITSIKFKKKNKENQIINDNNVFESSDVSQDNIMSKESNVNYKKNVLNKDHHMNNSKLQHDQNSFENDEQAINNDPLNKSNIESEVKNQFNNDNTSNFVNYNSLFNQVNQDLQIKDFNEELLNINSRLCINRYFYHPYLIYFLDEHYEHLSYIFMKLYNVPLLEKKLIFLFKNYNVKIPISRVNSLSNINSDQVLSINEVNLLFNCFDVLNFYNVFDNLVIKEVDNQIVLSNNTNGAIQVSGNEKHEILNHIRNFHKDEFEISPSIDIINKFIVFKNDHLIKSLIDKVRFSDYDELCSFSLIIKEENDNCKIYFLELFKTIIYNQNSFASYQYLKSYLNVVLSLSNTSLIKKYVFNKINIEVNPNEILNLYDLIYFRNGNVNFGNTNEFNISLTELFNRGEVNYFNHFEQLVHKLMNDNLLNLNILTELLNYSESDRKQYLYEKLSQSIKNSNTIPTGAQLAFLLLFKQIN
jgi:hypothetical protein